jgi:hypothetical protein
MYQEPVLEVYGTFRHLTQAGSTGASDGRAFFGGGSAAGSTPRRVGATVEYCFTNAADSTSR